MVVSLSWTAFYLVMFQVHLKISWKISESIENQNNLIVLLIEQFH
jgi:hypothetical protein